MLRFVQNSRGSIPPEGMQPPDFCAKIWYYVGAGMVIGAAIGMIFGLMLFENLALGSAIGAAVGLVIGAAIDA